MGAKITEAQVETARAAAETFSRMLPTMRGFAEALTKKSLAVEMSGTGTYTDGKTIYIRPPFNLGRLGEHDRAVCEERDDDGTMLCHACKTRESLLASVYHEVSHVAFGSFDPVRKDWRWLDAIRSIDHRDAKSVAAVMERHLTVTRKRNAPQQVADAVDEYLPLLVNALEDIRVDARMRAVRPGTADTQRFLREISLSEPGEDGRPAWKAQPLNAQAAVALICIAEGVDMERFLDEYVIHSVSTSDPVMRAIERVKESSTTSTDVLVAAVEVLLHMKDLGFFGGEPRTEGEDSSETESADGDAEESGDAGESGHGADEDERVRDDESSEEDTPAADGPGEADAEGGGGGDDEPEAGDHGDEDTASGVDATGGDGGVPTAPSPEAFGTADEAEDGLAQYLGHDEDGESHGDTRTPEDSQALESVVRTFKFFDAPSTEVTGVSVINDPANFPKSRGESSVTPKQLKADESILGPSLQHLRKALEENSLSKMDRNRRSGRVNSRVLGRRAWSDDDRLFKRKTVPGKRSYSVVIGIDVSGSTMSILPSGRKDGTVISLELKAAYAQAELCNRLGIEFAVYAHTGRGAGGGVELTIYSVKTFAEPWSTTQKARFAALAPMMANLDGHTLEFYRKISERSRATDKIIMYYSDGAMPCENYKEELAILQSEIETCRRKGITLMAVGVATRDPAKHGLDTARLDSLSDIPAVVKHLGKRIMEK